MAERDTMPVVVSLYNQGKTAITFQRATLLGHSMGGVVAMRYALGHPERVRSLILAEFPRGLRVVREGLTGDDEIVIKSLTGGSDVLVDAGNTVIIVEHDERCLPAQFQQHDRGLRGQRHRQERGEVGDEMRAAAPHLVITPQACPRFVEFVERGITSGRALLGLARSNLHADRAARRPLHASVRRANFTIAKPAAPK